MLISFVNRVSAQTSVPNLVNYQGRLTDGGGRPLTNGIYKIRFELFDTKSATNNLIWGTIYNVTAVGGQFNVVLGAVGASNVAGAAVNDLGFAFGGADRFLQMTILTDNTGTNNLPIPLILLPRQQILSAPYAVTALHGVPPGTILPYAGVNAPLGFIMCDGQSYAKAMYANLSSVLNNAYGGNASNFNVPDLRGRFLRGADDPDGPGTLYSDANRDPGHGTSANGGADGNRFPMAMGGNSTGVGSIQYDATRKNGLDLGGSTTFASSSHTHDAGSLYAEITYGLAQNFQIFLKKVNVPAWNSSYYGNNHPPGANFSQSITEATAVAGTSAVPSSSANVSLANGDPETRPINASVNYIIKY